jgi:hypothetical protein
MEAGMNGMRASAAYNALTRGGKLVLDVIAGEVERNGDGVAISLNNFAGLSRLAARNGVKQIVALGFVKLEFGPRRIGVFRLAHGWASVGSVDEAKRLVRAAKSPRAAMISKRRRASKAVKVGKPAPVETRARQRQQPSLPTLSCLQGDP